MLAMHISQLCNDFSFLSNLQFFRHLLCFSLNVALDASLKSFQVGRFSSILTLDSAA